MKLQTMGKILLLALLVIQPLNAAAKNFAVEFINIGLSSDPSQIEFNISTQNSNPELEKELFDQALDIVLGRFVDEYGKKMRDGSSRINRILDSLYQKSEEHGKKLFVGIKRDEDTNEVKVTNVMLYEKVEADNIIQAFERFSNGILKESNLKSLDGNESGLDSAKKEFVHLSRFASTRGTSKSETREFLKSLIQSLSKIHSDQIRVVGMMQRRGLTRLYKEHFGGESFAVTEMEKQWIHISDMAILKERHL